MSQRETAHRDALGRPINIGDHLICFDTDEGSDAIIGEVVAGGISQPIIRDHESGWHYSAASKKSILLDEKDYFHYILTKTEEGS
jgi:hypothetical protein